MEIDRKSRKHNPHKRQRQAATSKLDRKAKAQHKRRVIELQDEIDYDDEYAHLIK